MGYLRICKHQRLNFDTPYLESYFETLFWVSERQNAERIKGPSGTMHVSGAMYVLRFAFEMAQQRPRTAVRGRCPQCPVDFAVNFSPEKTTIHAWHDFGPEGTPLDLAWMVHARGVSDDDLELDHAEGSVRELYES
ncbi:hypothetical protein ACHAPT_006097 [Fusarium lateritium]